MSSAHCIWLVCLLCTVLFLFKMPTIKQEHCNSNAMIYPTHSPQAGYSGSFFLFFVCLFSMYNQEIFKFMVIFGGFLFVFCFMVCVWFFFYWSIVALHCCVSFCYTAKWISHAYTYIPSFLDFLPISRSPQSTE